MGLAQGFADGRSGIAGQRRRGIEDLLNEANSFGRQGNPRPDANRKARQTMFALSGGQRDGGGHPPPRWFKGCALFRHLNARQRDKLTKVVLSRLGARLESAFIIDNDDDENSFAEEAADEVPEVSPRSTPRSKPEVNAQVPNVDPKDRSTINQTTGSINHLSPDHFTEESDGDGQTLGDGDKNFS